MIKYAIHPDFDKVAHLMKLPEYSHGDAGSSMCIDMFSAEKRSFNFGADVGYFLEDGRDTVQNSSSYKLYSREDDYRPENPFVSDVLYAQVDTGIVFELPRGVHLSWSSRSGTAFKGGRMMFEGKIDSVYRGTVKGMILSLNPYDKDNNITIGEKFAQLEIVDYRTDSAKGKYLSENYKYEQLLEMAKQSPEYSKTGWSPSCVMEILSSHWEELYKLVKVPYEEINLDTSRGAAGFGSTGR